MWLQKIKIKNFKIFKGTFELMLNRDFNIIVGDNEEGKSTILEAVHLALSGTFVGRGINQEMSQYMFNSQVLQKYFDSLKEKQFLLPPEIEIELFFGGEEEELAFFNGDNNSDKDPKSSGICFKIALNDELKEEYEAFVKSSTWELGSLPIEYYQASWCTFARKEHLTPRMFPIKSTLIDSSNYRYQNGSDVYISKIVRSILDTEEIIDVAQAHRKMRTLFLDDDSIKAINKKISDETSLSDKTIKLAVDLGTKMAWENSLVTEIDEVPFHFAGKGTQCIVKTDLALSSRRAVNSGIILIEEPESHLSHTNLNGLIQRIKERFLYKQLIVTTHSSFVANKLNLKMLILLHNQSYAKLNDLSVDTQEFFEKMSGYDTLRYLLCRKAILVEGASDELVIQKAYQVRHEGHLPIEDGVEVISVGVAFLRFLELADLLKKFTVVVTDNDGDIESIYEKYMNYIGKRRKSYAKICVDEVIDSGTLMIGKSAFNYNTLEPKLLKANSLARLNDILGTDYTNEDDLRKYMKHHKTECALSIFKTDLDINFPDYIWEAVE